MHSPARLVAVLQADLRARLRRPAVAVLLAASAVSAVLLIPDPGPGVGLLRIGSKRALYTSQTLAFATATTLALVLSFFGFYVVSRALGRDVRAHVAGVVAATPVSDLEYLAGKLVGSMALLVAVGLGFMAAAMAMQVVRGEGPLEPVIYLAHYAVLCLPCVAWVAVLALLFECTPGLDGRFGDILYFFVWAFSIPLGIEGWKPGGPAIARVFDYMGLGFVVAQVGQISGTQTFSIGYGPAEVHGPPILFPGLSFTPDVLAARAASLVAPLLLFPVALVLFRRFDPARTSASAGSGRLTLPRWLRRLAGALVRPVFAPLGSVAPDAALLFRVRPAFALAALVFAVLGATLSTASVRGGLLPLVFVAVSLGLADVATRERSAGLLVVVYAAGRREWFAAWKLGSALVAALVLAGVPTLRLLLSEPGAGLAAASGLAFLAAASVALGIGTGTEKPFLALSLALSYLALSAKGRPPALDYGGWAGAATPATIAGWSLAALAAAGLALAAQRWRLARES